MHLGFFREALSGCATALERFFEFACLVMLDLAGLDANTTTVRLRLGLLLRIRERCPAPHEVGRAAKLIPVTRSVRLDDSGERVREPLVAGQVRDPAQGDRASLWHRRPWLVTDAADASNFDREVLAATRGGTAEPANALRRIAVAILHGTRRRISWP